MGRSLLGHHRLLAIGVNVAPGGRPLKFAEDDARRVRDLLTSSRGSVTDDELLLGAAATRYEVISHLEAMIAFPPEHLTIFFSGHGSDRGIALADDLLTYEELAYYLRHIATPIKVLVLDTCRAGAAARLFNERVAGATFAGEATDAAWVQALANACPGLRIFAAVGATELSRENDGLRGGIFTCAWLFALRLASGDIQQDGVYFISDLQAFREANRLIGERYPNLPRPELISRCRQGTLPLVQSQREACTGIAYVQDLHALPDRVAARARFHALERKHVATFVEWSVTAMTGAVVARGRELRYPTQEQESLEVVLPVDAATIQCDPLLGFWLRNGTGVELTWHVSLRDDIGRCLDAQSFSEVYAA